MPYFTVAGDFPRNRIIRRTDGKILFPYYRPAKHTVYHIAYLVPVLHTPDRLPCPRTTHIRSLTLSPYYTHHN